MPAQRLLLALLLIIIIALPACGSPPAGQPADAVLRFFHAVEAGDCDAAFATLSRAYRADIEQRHPCPDAITELRQISLDAVIDTRVDGRNNSAHLVRVHLRGRETDSLIRVEAEDGQWRIFSL